MVHKQGLEGYTAAIKQSYSKPSPAAPIVTSTSSIAGHQQPNTSSEKRPEKRPVVPKAKVRVFK